MNSDGTSEREIVEAISQGDRFAITELVEAYLPSVYDLSLRVTLDVELAEAAAEGAFRRLVEASAAPDEVIPANKWLLSVVRDEAIERLRERGRSEARPVSPLSLSPADPMFNQVLIET